MMMIRPIIGVIHIAAVLENIRVVWRNIDGLLRRRVLGIGRIGVGGRSGISLGLLRRSRVGIGGGRGTLLLHGLVHVCFRDRRGGCGGVGDHCRLVVDWCGPLRLCSRSALLLMCRYCCCCCCCGRCRVVRFVRAVSARWQIVSWCRWRDCWCSWWCCC